ncbi:hypothetical protein TNCV_1586331 [Trichonephila clavipes]|nr:hypothetical protein TNCV_1586331 [Trichonephila clavipes]
MIHWSTEIDLMLTLYFENFSFDLFLLKWQWQPNGQRVMNSSPLPLKTYLLDGLMHIKSVEAQSPPVGVMSKFGEGCRFRCCLHHLTVVQNLKVRHQLPSCYLILRRE